MLSLANLLDDTILLALTLESAQCAIQRFVISDTNFSH